MRNDIRFTLIFLGVCIGGVFVHEIGHAVLGWVQGIAVVPTPAKEYSLAAQIDWHQEIWISLGGIGATTILFCGVLLWYIRKQRPSGDAVLAGVLLPLGFYTLRFLVVGHGHDGLEWQGAQSAIGVNPSGHLIDLLFLTLFLVGCAAMVVRRGFSFRWKSLVRTVGLSLLGLVMVVLLQVSNNAVFDRFFREPEILNVPAEIEAR